jgi:hypothetical protein
MIEVADLSDLRCGYHLHRGEPHNVTVLVAAFSGAYGVGSKGNGDGVFIAAETMRGLIAFDPVAVVLDLRQMSYSWGNTLLSVFQAIDQQMNEEDGPPFPVFVVTSDLCRDAVLSLMGAGEGAALWHFSDMDAALNAASKAALDWLDA